MIRLQIFYSILGLDPAKGIDITINERNVSEYDLTRGRE